MMLFKKCWGFFFGGGINGYGSCIYEIMNVIGGFMVKGIRL